jgi:hypothetical protein
VASIYLGQTVFNTAMIAVTSLSASATFFIILSLLLQKSSIEENLAQENFIDHLSKIFSSQQQG